MHFFFSFTGGVHSSHSQTGGHDEMALEDGEIKEETGQPGFTWNDDRETGT